MSYDDSPASNSGSSDKASLLADLAWLVGLLLVVGGGGFFGTLAGRFVGAGLCASVLVFLPARCTHIPNTALAVLFFLVFLYVPNVVVVLGLATAFTLCCWRTDSAYWPLTMATTTLFVLHAILFFVPELHSGLAGGCYRLTDWLSSLTPLPCRLGPTYLGLDSIVLCSAYSVGVVSLVLKPSVLLEIVTMLITGLLTSTLSVVFHAFLPSIVGWFHRHVPFGTVHIHRHVDFAVVMTFAPLSIPFFVVAVCYALRVLMSRRNEEKKTCANLLSWPRWSPVFYLITLCFALFLCLLQRDRWSLDKDCGKQVCFVDAGLLDLNLPDYERTGHANVGMFGLFERCLKETGRRVTHIPTLNDLDVMNPQPDVVIMINPTGVVEQAEQKLYSYLATGGSLLLMGDHTDIAGSQECLNRILHPLGASIRFDSGFPAGRAWSLRYDLQCHRVTASLDRMNQGLQWGTGATLDLKGISWFPLLIGKYVFSDIGNRLNTNNAFLGDYSYQPGELLGDVILAAERSVGRGRIVALGDTTSFQNLAIIRSWPFLDRLVTHLTGRSHAQGQLMFALSVCVFASLLIILFWSQTWRLLAISTIVLAASGLDLLARRPWEVKYPPRPVALVDVCYANRLNLEHWRNDSIDGLLINLIRSGFWPILSNTTGIEDINAPSAKIVIAPQKKRSKSDFASWENDAMAGTTLLLSVGYPTETSVACWLQEQGLIINNEPLGPVPIRGRGPYENFLRRSQEPQFSEAWSVSLQSAVWKSIYAWGGRDVVVERNLGLGRLVVIADPLFLLDRTLEAEKEAWPGNIYFLQSLLHNQPGTAN